MPILPTPAGALVAVPATTAEGAPWLLPVSVEDGAVVLDDVELTADAARSLAASLLVLADELDATGGSR